MTLREMDTRALLKGVHTLGFSAHHAITRPLMRLLSRGGKFIVTPRMPQLDLRREREQAFKDYARSVRLRIMFSRQDSGRPFDRRYHVPNPAWQPSRASPAVEAQLEDLGQRLQQTQAALPRHEGFNCAREEREALGRPIVACHSWSTWPRSKWVANRINTYASSQETVLTDTNALIAMLRGVEFAEDDAVLLCTADVESLYTSIPIADALSAVEERLRACGVEETFLRITIAAIELVLKLNFFEFNGRTYHQKRGLAMGTPLAPPVANLFLASLEARLMRGVPPPVLYVRFLDDILVVQNLSETGPEALLWDGLHAMHPDIRLTQESSPCAVDFLDLQIYRDGKRLLHRVHQKALNKYLYISPRSCHPRHVIEGFVRTELIRYARNSSTELDFVRICHAFSNRLRERGFHPSFLKHLFASVDFQHYAVRRAREAPMVFKALYVGRIANSALSRTIKEWYDATPADFKTVIPKPVMCHLNGQNIYKKLVRAKVPT